MTFSTNRTFAKRAWHISKSVQLYVSNEIAQTSYVNPYPGKPAPTTEIAQKDLALDLIKESKQYGLDSITLGNNNSFSWEPLPHVLELAKRLDFWVNIRTNGWHIKKMVPLLKKHKNDIQTIWIELVGMTANTHDTLTGRPGSHQQVLETILECLKLHITVGIEWVTLEENIAETGNFLAYISQMEIPKVYFHLAPANRAISTEPKNHDSTRLNLHKLIFTDYWDGIRKMEIFRITHPNNKGWKGSLPHIEHAPYQISPTGMTVPCTMELTHPTKKWPTFGETTLINAIRTIDELTNGQVIPKTEKIDNWNLGRYPICCMDRKSLAQKPGD